MSTSDTDLSYLGPLARRFCAADRPELATDLADFEVVTGFGPTNAPTAGTLSVMLGIVDLQKALGARVNVVISDLGAWNCRNVEWSELCTYRDRMAQFLIALGFDLGAGTIRTHINEANLVRAGRIARYLSLDDLHNHQEEFLELYGASGLLGSSVGLLVDTLYTVADILQPIDEAHGATLMVSGIEESYFTRLSRIVMERQYSQTPGLGWQGNIGALYFRIVRGLDRYPKMSKSIPSSSIHVGLTPSDLASRILSNRPEDQLAIMDAIDLASDWPEEDRNHAWSAFSALPASANQWHAVKARYLETFLRFTEMWRATEGATDRTATLLR